MVKVVSLSNEAYEKLKALKRNMSFSETIIEIIGKKEKKSLMDFFGIWKEDDEYWKDFKKKIREDREKSKLREIKL